MKIFGAVERHVLDRQYEEAELSFFSVMSESSPSPASESWKLDSCLDALQKELSLNQTVYDATERALEQIARMYYPRLASWDPKLLSTLSDRIRSAAHGHCLTLANLDFVSKHGKDGEIGAV